MTYCVAIQVDEGIVFGADTRTNAGVDYVTSYRKLHVFAPAQDRSFVLLAAGSLATTRELIDRIERDLAFPPNGASLSTAGRVFEAAEYVGRLSREIQEKHGAALARSGVTGEVTLILGGQIRGGPPELRLIYPQGNYIGVSDETPYLQIGETKYGKPVLDRLVRKSLPLSEAAKLALVSMDATVRSNITVAAPFDFALYPTDHFAPPTPFRIESDSPYYHEVREAWQRGFAESFAKLPAFPAPLPSTAPPMDPSANFVPNPEQPS
ncbi:MAG: 20S proteasome subunit A/B [Myxococcota bacterium]